jgi:predicted nucleic acid-binding Zn ribbon protein
VKSGDKSEKICPECGANCKRIPSSNIGLVFIGSGFYINDYKDKKKEKQHSKE